MNVMVQSCECNYFMLQHCKCNEVVIVKPMTVINRALYRDADFRATYQLPYFIVELADVDDVIAIFPSQIRQKCISLSAAGKTYFCPLPYRIYCD